MDISFSFLDNIEELMETKIDSMTRKYLSSLLPPQKKIKFSKFITARTQKVCYSLTDKAVIYFEILNRLKEDVH